MIYYIIFVLAVLVVSLFGLAFFERYKDLKEFRGDSLEDSSIISRILERIIPPSGTRMNLRIRDYLFIINDYISIKQFYFMRLITTLVGVLVGVMIVLTNVYTSYTAAFEVRKDVPIEFTYQSYKTLKSGLTFIEDEKERDTNLIKSNLSLVKEEELVDLYSGTNSEKLYTYLFEINKEMNSLVGPFDFLILFLIIVVGFQLPYLILVFLYKTMRENSLLEFDDLETDIAILSDQKVDDILKVLQTNSMYYRNMFYEFGDIYDRSPRDAYEMIESRPEFPDHFKRLVRYLSMIESHGSLYVKNNIEANKKQTEEDVFDRLQMLSSRRCKRLKNLCVVAFLLAISRIIIVLFTLLL